MRLLYEDDFALSTARCAPHTRPPIRSRSVTHPRQRSPAPSWAGRFWGPFLWSGACCSSRPWTSLGTRSWKAVPSPNPLGRGVAGDRPGHRFAGGTATGSVVHARRGGRAPRPSGVGPPSGLRPQGPGPRRTPATRRGWPSSAGGTSTPRAPDRARPAAAEPAGGSAVPGTRAVGALWFDSLPARSMYSPCPALPESGVPRRCSPSVPS